MTYWIKDPADLKNFIDEHFKYLCLSEFTEDLPRFPFRIEANPTFDGVEFWVDGAPLRQNW